MFDVSSLLERRVCCFADGVVGDCKTVIDVLVVRRCFELLQIQRLLLLRFAALSG